MVDRSATMPRCHLRITALARLLLEDAEYATLRSPLHRLNMVSPDDTLAKPTW